MGGYPAPLLPSPPAPRFACRTQPLHQAPRPRPHQAPYRGRLKQHRAPLSCRSLEAQGYFAGWLGGRGWRLQATRLRPVAGTSCWAARRRAPAGAAPAAPTARGRSAGPARAPCPLSRGGLGHSLSSLSALAHARQPLIQQPSNSAAWGCAGAPSADRTQQASVHVNPHTWSECLPRRRHGAWRSAHRLAMLALTCKARACPC